MTNRGRRRAAPHGHRRTPSGPSACSGSTRSIRCHTGSSRGRSDTRTEHFDPHFAGWVAFCAMSEPVTGYTADRREFLGRNGTPAAPAALRAPGSRRRDRRRRSTRAPRCNASLELAPGRRASSPSCSARRRDERTRRTGWPSTRRRRRARAAVEASVARGSDGCRHQVRTPEPAFDIMLNRWTLYQALACRMWARSALYQTAARMASAISSRT